ncbi:branched-chain amino acid ABC transporter permease [Candidatus Poriferisodalis sp.]|uniref:branched-chain amino acid ABC transporter permease n=1 Tax=Candidatus Poriferisodalis sp. TaxID=3101277 RepID=UPI003B01B547
MPLTSSVTEFRDGAGLVVTVVAVLGVTIATGFGGVISLGHGVFVATGAFGTAIAVNDLKLSWIGAVVLGAAIAGVLGALVALPMLRIRGIYLALVTLGLAMSFQPVVKRFPALTGGVGGRGVDLEVLPASWLGTSRWAVVCYRYLICIAAVAVVLWLTHNLVNSRAGRAMRAVRDNETAAAVYGVNIVSTRVATFAVSAAVSGFAGALGVVLVPYVSQESYPPQESLLLYALAVLGGLHSVWGAVAAVAIREVAEVLGAQLARVDGLGPLSEFFDLLADERFLFALALVALTLLFPHGLTGSGSQGARRSGGRHRGSRLLRD